jgi:hypothetical protein
MDHVIRFNGHVSWDGRANGLPETIYAFLMMKGYDRAMYNQAIEAQFAAFAASQFMVVAKDQGSLIDARQMPADRMAVPIRWITCIDVNIIPMVGELSLPDEKGVERLDNGEEPLKQ